MNYVNYANKAHLVLEQFSTQSKCLFAGPFCLVFDGSEIVVKMELRVGVDGVQLAYIENLKKSGGYGRRVLEKLVEVAKQNECPIVGEIDLRFGRSKKQLVSFYRQFGAEIRGNRFVIS